MTSDQRTQVTEAIDEFKAEYITDDMSEFEKEIAIIKWIVENCEYEAAEDDNDWSMATAYSVMIEGKGQCAGYADAFLQMAKACGLDARYVYNNIHAWNLVKLDGDWYHVDVTWEDPIGSNDYGDSGLRNYYINLTDDEIKEVSSHKTWSPSSIKANGTKYDYFVVKKYLETGEVDVNVKDEIEEQFKEELKGYETINYSTVDDAAGKIVDVLKKKIDNRDSGYKVAVIFNDLNPLNATDSLEAYDRADQIEEKVNATINAQYGDVLFNAFKLYLFRGNEKPYKKAFVTGSGSLRYKEGYGKMVDYKIHFIDTETGEEVGIQEGSGELNRQVEYKFPEHYVWISNLPAVSEITSGSGRNNGKSFTITSSSEAFEMNLKVRIDKNHYTIQYIDKNNEIISTQSGCEDKGVTISFKLPEGYSVSSVDADKDQIKLNEDNFGTITGFTLKADRKHVSVKVNLKNEVSEDTTEKEPISENLINSITNATKAEAATPSTPKR